MRFIIGLLQEEQLILRQNPLFTDAADGQTGGQLLLNTQHDEKDRNRHQCRRGQHLAHAAGFRIGVFKYRDRRCVYIKST